MGQAIRATAQDREAARLMGINVEKMSMIAFGLGASLAATAGALVSPTYYIFPQIGSMFTLKAFVITAGGDGQHSRRNAWRHPDRRHRIHGRRVHFIGLEGRAGLRALSSGAAL